MTNLSGVAAPKPPKRKREHVKVYPDGREVCTAAGYREYMSRRDAMAVRQNGRCALCGDYMFFQTFDHERSRGGGKRDDRIEVDGKWQNAAVHFECNTRKGSKRYAWVNGKYVPVPKEKS